jgi:hypothetical protein
LQREEHGAAAKERLDVALERLGDQVHAPFGKTALSTRPFQDGK